MSVDKSLGDIPEVFHNRRPWAIEAGDALHLLRLIPDESLHSVVTSPPYWGLRDYKTEPTVWAGDPECDHDWQEGMVQRGSNDANSGAKQQTNRGSTGRDVARASAFCARCGAWRGLLGMEPEPLLFVRNLGLIFAEVRRVLRKDGLLWLNMGDSYAGSWGNYGTRKGLQRPRTSERWSRKAYEDPDAGFRDRPATLQVFQRDAQSFRRDRQYVGDVHHKRASGLKPKDLVGTPWRVAFGLQGFAVVAGFQLDEAADMLAAAREEGDWQGVEEVEGMLRSWAAASSFLGPWWNRSDCIWFKPNVMPESVADRPTKAHEYLFMLAKSERYFYDAEAIKEPLSPTSIARLNQATFWEQKGGPKDYARAGISDHRSSRSALEGLARRQSRGEPDGRARMNYNRDRELGIGTHDNPFDPRAVVFLEPDDAPPLLLPGMAAPDVGPPGRYGQRQGRSRDRPGPEENTAHQQGNVPWEDDGSGRNKRTVWEIPTRASGEEHYAAFPLALVEPAIKAGTSERGCCPECGAPWARLMVYERAPRGDAFGRKVLLQDAPHRDHDFDRGQSGKEYEQITARIHVGWAPTCKHYDGLYQQLPRARSARRQRQQDAVDALPKSRRAKLNAGWWERARRRPGGDTWSTVPAIVLDPFVGSGQAGIEARRLFRRFIGLDLNPAYVELARRRIRDDAPLFNA